MSSGDLSVDPEPSEPEPFDLEPFDLEPFDTVVADRASTEMVPAIVARYLQPDERQVISVRRHPVRLAPVILPLALVLTDYGLHASGAVHGTAQATRILGVLAVTCGLAAGYSIMAWLTGYFVITANRMLIYGWWPIRHLTQIPIGAAGELTFIRTPVGRVLGYGTFRLRRPGSRWRAINIRFIPYPEQLFLETSSLIFRDANAGYDDD
jgi:hypothetical protein